MPVVIIPAYKPDETLITITDRLWRYGCQIIVVDDGSTDRTGKIADKYVLEYPDIVKAVHKENGGHGSVLSLYIICTEMYLCFRSVNPCIRLIFVPNTGIFFADCLHCWYSYRCSCDFSVQGT